MHRPPSLSLVVPVFNEQERFAEHARELAGFVRRHPLGSELLVVDDGSTDRTVEVVEAFLAGEPDLRAKLLRRPHRGKGATVRAGLGAAGAEYAGFCDVDLSTPLAELERILAAACMGPVLAIGSRDAPASELARPQHPVREWLGKTYNRAVQLTLTPGVLDTQCGAKVAATELWERILPYSREPHLAWDVEIVALARRLGIAVQEVAVCWADDPRSRVRLGRDGLAMVAALPRIARTVRSVPASPAADRPARRAAGLRVAPAGAVPAAPAAARAPAGVFDQAQADTLAAAEGHWWFRSKAAVVGAALRRHVPRAHRAGYLLDVGAGSGGVTALLGWPPDRLVAVEGSAALARAAHDRHALLAVTALGDRLPVRDGCVAVVSLLDVLEHLERVEPTLAEVRRVLAPDGCLVVTVPAHRWLWSRADELLGHHRRYTRPLLRGQLAAAGLRPVGLTHVFGWLVPPVWLVRRLAPVGGERQLGLDRRSPLLDALAFLLTRVELALVRRVSLPLGTSIVCVAVKA